MTEPVRLNPDPSVALVAYRFPAEAPGPQRFHDVALMLGEASASGCPVGLYGTGVHSSRHRDTHVVCINCGGVLRFWQCDCPDATFRERACKHVLRAIELYAEERRAARGGS